MALTIQYCSDLHLEFELNQKWIRKYPLQVQGDILLLAGDIVPFDLINKHSDFFDFLGASYQAVYWIPGNHEYYGTDIGMRSGALHEAIRTNVFLVNNTTVTIGDVAIVAATLWSEINMADALQIKRIMGDFHAIRSGSDLFSVSDFNALHHVGKAFVTHDIRASSAKHTVVLTHHVPTFLNYPEKYKGDILNQAFAVELQDFILASDVDSWIYGHTHCNTPDFLIGKTRMLTNQLGYVRYGEHSSFSQSKTMVVG
jgi:predicted phosphohydrolase